MASSNARFVDFVSQRVCPKEKCTILDQRDLVSQYKYEAAQVEPFALQIVRKLKRFRKKKKVKNVEEEPEIPLQLKHSAYNINHELFSTYNNAYPYTNIENSFKKASYPRKCNEIPYYSSREDLEFTTKMSAPLNVPRMTNMLKAWTMPEEPNTSVGEFTLKVKRSIFVGNIPSNISKKMFLHTMETIGEITEHSCNFKPNCWSTAFLSFARYEEALRAIDLLGNGSIFKPPPSVVQGFSTHLSLHKCTSENSTQLSQYVPLGLVPKPFTPKYSEITKSSSLNIENKTRFSLLKDGPAGANLFVYGIPSDWSEVYLLILFQHFGNVVGLRVREASNNTSCNNFKSNVFNRGYGFVSYDNTESFLRAYRTLDRKVLYKKRLNVHFKSGDQFKILELIQNDMNAGTKKFLMWPNSVERPTYLPPANHNPDAQFSFETPVPPEESSSPPIFASDQGAMNAQIPFNSVEAYPSSLQRQNYFGAHAASPGPIWSQVYRDLPCEKTGLVRAVDENWVDPAEYFGRSSQKAEASPELKPLDSCNWLVADSPEWPKSMPVGNHRLDDEDAKQVDECSMRLSSSETYDVSGPKLTLPLFDKVLSKVSLMKYEESSLYSNQAWCSRRTLPSSHLAFINTTRSATVGKNLYLSDSEERLAFPQDLLSTIDAKTSTTTCSPSYGENLSPSYDLHLGALTALMSSNRASKTTSQPNTQRFDSTSSELDNDRLVAFQDAHDDPQDSYNKSRLSKTEALASSSLHSIDVCSSKLHKAF